MSTKDQLLFSALHGTAMRYAAERRNLDESIEELRQMAGGSDDILAEETGITAGSTNCTSLLHQCQQLSAYVGLLASYSNSVAINLRC